MDLDEWQPPFADMIQDGRFYAVLASSEVIVGDEDGVAPTDAVLGHAVWEADTMLIVTEGRRVAAVVQASMSRSDLAKCWLTPVALHLVVSPAVELVLEASLDLGEDGVLAVLLIDLSDEGLEVYDEPVEAAAGEHQTHRIDSGDSIEDREEELGREPSEVGGFREGWCRVTGTAIRRPVVLLKQCQGHDVLFLGRAEKRRLAKLMVDV